MIVRAKSIGLINNAYSLTVEAPMWSILANTTRDIQQHYFITKILSCIYADAIIFVEILFHNDYSRNSVRTT